MLTRAGYITAPAIERLRPEFDALGAWQDDISGLFIAGSYAAMRMDKEARTLEEQYRLPGAQFVPGLPMDALASQALAVSIMVRHFPEMLRDMGDDLGQRMTEACSGSMPSTFSAALGVRALVQLAMGASAAKADAMQGAGLRCVGMHKGFAPLPEDQSTSMWQDAVGGMLTLDVPGCARAEILNPQGDLPTVYYEVSAAGYTSGVRSTKPVSEGMEVTRTWLDADGASVTKVKQGDVLTVKVKAKLYGEGAQDVVICDLLPGGFAFELGRADDQQDNVPSGARLERREYRMLIFTSLDKQGQTFTYKVRATQAGDFVLPALQGEAMYDAGIHSNSAESRVKVD